MGAVTPTPAPYFSSGSAVPAYVQENLPAYFKARPATTEAVWAGLISARNGLTIVLGTLYGIAPHSSFASFCAFVAQNWWSLGLPALFIAQRSATAFSKAKTPAP